MTKADKAISYRHNALGQRVAKLVDGVVTEKYLWQDLTTLLAVYDANDNVKQRFEYGLSHTPVSFTQSGQRYYIQTDHLGSPRVISSATGTVIKTISYDSYGNVISDSNPDFSIPFGFAGGLYDADTKLVRFGYRDYDPETGRWTARDPIGFAGGDTNLYGYVLGDPINFIDPVGLMSWNWSYFWAGASQGVVDAQATLHYFDVSDGADPCSSEYRIGMAFGQAFARGSQGPYARSPALRMTSNVTKKANPLDGTTFTDKVKRQMNGKDTDHNFPSLVDQQANAASVKKITGGDGIERTKVELPGSINGKDGNFSWIIEPDKTINHRQFERLKKK